MANDRIAIRDYLTQLGLEPEIAETYLVLRAGGPQGLLQLARSAKIERTRLYRLIDVLLDHQLVEVETRYKRKIYKAAPIGNLEILLARKEEELRKLQAELGSLQETCQTPVTGGPRTYVQFYHGTEGVKQMFWNQTKTSTENLSILYENMQNKTYLAFFERWTLRCNEKGIKFRSIVSDHFLANQRTWYETHDNEKLQNWAGRHLSDKIFPITHSTVVYNNVVAYYSWEDGEIFGFEIYNQAIADTQRHVFEMLWRQAQPIRGHGELAKPLGS